MFRLRVPNKKAGAGLGPRRPAESRRRFPSNYRFLSTLSIPFFAVPRKLFQQPQNGFCRSRTAWMRVAGFLNGSGHIKGAI